MVDYRDLDPLLHADIPAIATELERSVDEIRPPQIPRRAFAQGVQVPYPRVARHDLEMTKISARGLNTLPHDLAHQTFLTHAIITRNLSPNAYTDMLTRTNGSAHNLTTPTLILSSVF